MLNIDGLGAFFDVRMWYCVAGAMDSAPGQKRAKREGCGRRGTFEEDLQKCMSHEAPETSQSDPLEVREQIS